ncbi:peptidoglycan DD-metalloendopeptidase family protein [Nocardia sp. CA-120079]|uniref:peptidoglycan DD-metalloendopeptidase family protein n=1 Tax=Nocardia sp. CA-120079 TaxID=3239974 RepID=UPI003D985727
MSGSEGSGSGKLWVTVAVCALVLCSAAALVFSGRLPHTPGDANCLPVPKGGPVAPGSVLFPMQEGTYTISDVFGSRGGAHKGTDLAAPKDTPVYAPADATVVAAGAATGFGHWVVLDLDRKIDNQTVSFVVGHMFQDGVLVSKDQRVRAGDPIAKVGSDGESSGPHAHIEIWIGGRFSGGTAIDPMGWFANAKTAPGPATNPGATTGQASATATASRTDQVALAAAVRPATGVGCGANVGGAGLDVSKLVAEYPAAAAFVPWIIKGATACPDTSAPLIAAQLRNESRFQKDQVSPSGALGYAQFMPATWAKYGVDADGDGRADPNSIADAVMSQAAYNCVQMGTVKAGLAAGTLTGDPIELMLSMYNCGPAATQANRGVCANAETQRYVKEIPETARRWSLPLPVPGGALTGGFGERAVQAARRWIGAPYVWGGGAVSGPTAGGAGGEVGFDCSGLMIYAVAAASDGRIVLGHYTTTQLNDPRGKPVDTADLAAGDLVFPAGSDPQHVAMAIGGDQIVEAPQPGGTVKISLLATLGPGFQARRFT